MAANLTKNARSCENNSRRNNRVIEEQECLSLSTLTSYIQKLSSTMSSQSKHMRTKVSFKISSWQRQDHEDGVPFRRLRRNSHDLKKGDCELPPLSRVKLRLNPSKSPLTSENRHKRNCYFELEGLSRPTRQRRRSHTLVLGCGIESARLMQLPSCMSEERRAFKLCEIKNIVIACSSFIKIVDLMACLHDDTEFNQCDQRTGHCIPVWPTHRSLHPSVTNWSSHSIFHLPTALDGSRINQTLVDSGSRSIIHNV